MGTGTLWSQCFVRGWLIVGMKNIRSLCHLVFSVCRYQENGQEERYCEESAVCGDTRLHVRYLL